MQTFLLSCFTVRQTVKESLETKNKTQYHASHSTGMVSSLVTRKAIMTAKDSVCHMQSLSDLLRKAKSVTHEAKRKNAIATNT